MVVLLLLLMVAVAAAAAVVVRFYGSAVITPSLPATRKTVFFQMALFAVAAAVLVQFVMFLLLSLRRCAC